MSVYLGRAGEIQLQRRFNGEQIDTVIQAANVNLNTDRFTLPENNAGINQLVTGDLISIVTVNKEPLPLLDEKDKNGQEIPATSSITKFAYVDEIGGIRLFNLFSEAVNGAKKDRIKLKKLTKDYPVRIKVESVAPKMLAQVTSYEINTSREAVDVTTLSDEFRSKVNTLISGSGRFSAYWEYTNDTINELPNYIVELAMRTKVGSTFSGKFYLKTREYNRTDVLNRKNDEVYYEFDALLTNVSVAFGLQTAVQIEAEFVTTGPVQLRMKIEQIPLLKLEDKREAPVYDESKILLEQDPLIYAPDSPDHGRLALEYDEKDED